MIPYFLKTSKCVDAPNFIVASAVFRTKSVSLDDSHIRDCPRGRWEDNEDQRAPIDLKWPPGLGCQVCPLRPCRTIDFICCDAVHTAIAWTFAVHIGVDCSRWPFFHFSCCGLFAARTAPSDTIIYFLRGRSTNPRKGLAEVVEDRATGSLGRGPAMRRIFD